MKFGYCLDIQFLNGDTTSRTIFDAVAEAGFDYVELPFSAISALDSGKIAQLKQALTTIPCKACNLFFPPSLTIVGSKMDLAGIKSYLERMLPLAEELGMENLVFGNGGARKTPPGESREDIRKNLRTIAETMETYAEKSKIIISIEPLNTTETDIINSYAEAVDLTKGLTHVSAMIDSYHVVMENQNYDDVLQTPSEMKHLHTAYSKERLVPSPNDDMNHYADFVKTVKQLGYNNKISIEGKLRATDSEGIAAEVKASLTVLKNLFA